MAKLGGETLPLEDMVEPKLISDPCEELRLSMEPMTPPAPSLRSVLCLPPGLRSTLSSLGGTNLC